MATALESKQEQLETKHKLAGAVLEAAGQDLDFSKKDVLEKLGATDAKDAADKFRLLNDELAVIQVERDRLYLEDTARQHRERDEALKRPVRHPVSTKSTGDDHKTFGQLVVESEQYQAYMKSKSPVSIGFPEMELKTLFATTAGWAPRPPRIDRVIDAVTRPIQVLDLIPMMPTDSATIFWMLETTRTHAAAEKAEGVAYAESTFVLTEQQSPVQKITDSIPVTDEQLQDIGQAQGYLNQRLLFGVRQRLDLQVVLGDGTAPNLSGILDTAVQTQAKGTDPQIVAFFKALTKVRFTGRANPTGAIFHPNDWQDTVLTQNSNGDYLFGNPFMGAGPESLFGIPVAVADVITENTALVGDFATFCALWQKRGIEVEVGFVGTQFTEGKKTIRAQMRVAFTVYRPTAFCSITGM